MFSTLQMGDQELKNRIVMAPLTRTRATGTEPNELMVEYYRQRATAGLIISEATAVSEEAYGWANAPMVVTLEQARLWKKITDVVHEKNGKIFMQLWHMGRQSHSSFHPKTKDIVSASNVKITSGTSKDNEGNNVEWETPRALSVEEIEKTIQDYVKAARLAKEAGFDGLEIHAANGYLLDQFLQSRTNLRTDQYGGSFENRLRILSQLLDAIIADGSFPASRIGVRFSPNGTFGDMGSEDNYDMFLYAAAQMKQYGLAYLHVMDGLGFGYHGKSKAVTAADVKQAFEGLVMTNVGLTKESAQGMLRSGAVDLVAFGRLYISNPDLVERFQNDWPLNPDSAYEDWWQSSKGASGYTDFPFYQPPKETTVDDKEMENLTVRDSTVQAAQ